MYFSETQQCSMTCGIIHHFSILIINIQFGLLKFLKCFFPALKTIPAFVESLPVVSLKPSLTFTHRKRHRSQGALLHLCEEAQRDVQNLLTIKK